VKSSETSRERGYDVGSVNRRRRHILMDTMGSLLMVLDFSACVQDQAGACRLPIMKRSGMIPLPLISSNREGFDVAPGLRGLQSLCRPGVVVICLDNLLIICR
jgi:hypothetical protein